MLIEYKNHKIFAFSDTHGLNHRLDIPKDVDILICAGDCLKEDNMVYVDNEFVKFLNWYSHQDAKLKIYVPGNHEVFFEMNPEKVMQRALKTAETRRKNKECNMFSKKSSEKSG
jgi:alpha-beta hydrolase superfamily lysophospholipase